MCNLTTCLKNVLRIASNSALTVQEIATQEIVKTNVHNVQP